MAGRHVQLYSRTPGFWIECGDPPRCHEIQEHLLAVEADPTRFGLTPGFLAEQRKTHKDRAAYRAAVLTAAMRNGFVRVRGHGDHTTFQFHCAPQSEHVTRAILWFCNHVRMADVERVLVGNLADGTLRRVTWGGFRITHTDTERGKVS